MKPRTNARCSAIQVLYAFETLEMKDLPDADADKMLERYSLSSHLKDFAKQLVLGYVKHKDEIDELISRATYNWNLKRMTPVDRNIIRIATYEMLFEDDIPVPVSINEAIEIAKIYSTRTSGSFVNGVLDSIRKSFVYNKKRDKSKSEQTEPIA
ncbi:MAG: transcription antitermination factor NusB [Planctomycetes bacterium]|nr:transcription antitermination factor NusB [Planctomycetota bacterium]